MNFKKLSEMCKPEVKEQEVCSVLIGEIAEGTVFSGKPKGYSAGVFLKLGRDIHYRASPGAVRLTYDNGDSNTCGFIFESEREIQDYKVLNVTLVDEDA